MHVFDTLLKGTTSESRRLFLLIADMFALSAALYSAFSLRLSEWYPELYLKAATELFLIVPVLGVAIFYRLGLYRAVLRYMGVRVLRAVAIGVVLLVLTLYALAQVFHIEPFPRSVPIIFGMAAWLYLGGTRLLVRSYYYWVITKDRHRERIIIFGAGSAGAQLALMLQNGSEYWPVAIVDDDKRLVGRYIGQLKVSSAVSIGRLIEEHRASRIVIAMPSIDAKQLRDVLGRLQVFGVPISKTPSAPELVSGEAVDSVRDVSIEDLLGRDVVPAIPRLMSGTLHRRSVLVTGGGGSIGSEIAHIAIEQGAKTLVIYDISEFALFNTDSTLRQKFLGSDTKIVSLIGSVLDRERLERAMKKYEVDTVFHAAAYKHVPIVEQNVLQGILTNSFGTKIAAEASVSAGVKRFVLISTDKAVRPTNVMGATKRLAEMFVQDLSKRSADTVMCNVRFGNVLGSSGSVVPIFEEQVKRGGPVTVTHPDVTRYFMTIPEAASLVVQAGAMALGGEVFVLDMGKPVRIVDLARNLIELKGLSVKSEENPHGDIEIAYSGLRPGEKLYEELLIGDNATGSEHPLILKAQENCLPHQDLTKFSTRLSELIHAHDAQAARALLADLVEGYVPDSSASDLLESPRAANVLGFPAGRHA